MFKYSFTKFKLFIISFTKFKKELVMPIRKIPIQTRSIAGNFYSYRNSKTIKYESQLEKKVFLLLEFDENVISYEEQPLKVENYVPDILIKTKEGKDILVEVKYQSEVDKQDDRLIKKIDTLTKYCNDNNMEFKLYTDKDIVEPYFFNISLIYNYTRINVSDSQKKYILETIMNNDSFIALGDLISRYNINISYVYSLIFHRYIDINLYKKITNNSIVKAIQ